MRMRIYTEAASKSEDDQNHKCQKVIRGEGCVCVCVCVCVCMYLYVLVSVCVCACVYEQVIILL